MAENDNFLSRWSRRKSDARNAKAPATVDEHEHSDALSRDRDLSPDLRESETRPPARGEDPAQEVREQGDDVARDLPDIDSLGPGSDFSAFMREGVPEKLRTMALRKLWQSNPIFSVVDRLNEYDEDFTDAALVLKGGVTSAWKPGRGYRSEEEESQTPTENEPVDDERENQSADDVSAVDADQENAAVADPTEGKVPDNDSSRSSPRPSSDKEQVKNDKTDS